MEDGVSVIIPTYNDADVLPKAIESVLNQTHENIELIVVDDASEDNTEEVVKQYMEKDSRVNYIKHKENKERSAARNTGIKHASKQFLAFIDSDDKWLPSKLEKQISYLKKKGDGWVVVHCNRKTDPEPKFTLPKSIGVSLKKEGGKELIKNVLLGNIIDPGSNLLLKTKVVKKMDGFDETMSNHEDYHFLIRVLKRGKLAYLDEKLSIIERGNGGREPENVCKSKFKLLNDFNKEVKYFEKKGYPISSYQYSRILQYYWKHGKLQKASKFLFKTIKRIEVCNYKTILIPMYQLFIFLFFFPIGIKQMIEDKF